jgi:hypothetical protein
MKVLNKVDPHTAAGVARTACDGSFVTQVSGQSLQIDFIGNVAAVLVNGIEIVPSGTSPLSGARVIRGSTVTKEKSR